MSTDSQGRPLSDDGQWAWNGTEWVPAAVGAPSAPVAGGGAATGGAVGEPGGDAGATTIAPSPFAGGGPHAGAPVAGAPGGGAPTYGQPPAQGGVAPGYPGAAGYGSPPQQGRSRKRLIAAIVLGVLIIAAVVVVLIVTLGGKDKKSPKLAGPYVCTAPGSSETGTITFNGSNYTLSDQGKPGGFTTSDNKITFNSDTGSLAKATGTISADDRVVTITFEDNKLTCTKK